MEINELYTQAQALGVCSKFTGKENAIQLLRLFISPQGIEFCAKHNWPTIEQIRSFKGEQAEQLGIYIDAGDRVFHNPEKVVLIGNTQATLTFDDPATMRHQVLVMHGASAHVSASNWAVVFCSNIGGTIHKETTKNAIIR